VNKKTGRFEDDEGCDEFFPPQDTNSKRHPSEKGRPPHHRSTHGKEEDDDDEEYYSDDDGRREYDGEEDFDEDEEEVVANFGRGGSKKPIKYRDDDYEFGEYGFPDDGYDYTKHFKPTGGGGVYIPAVRTFLSRLVAMGLPNLVHITISLLIVFYFSSSICL